MKKFYSLALLTFFLTACHSMASPEHKHDNKTTAARINVQLGMAYMERHEVQRAKQKFLLAMHEAPQLPEVWYSMGYFFEVSGEPARASQSYLKALEIAPRRGDVNNNYGTYLCRSHNYQLAIKYFVKATQDIEYLDPASAYENAGLCAELIPNDALAMKYFEDALRQDPNRPLTLISMAELNYKQGQYAAARSLLSQFLMLSPETAESRALSAKLAKKG